MSFDAGSIVGKLGLDIGDYTKGILSAEAIASVFPSIVTTALVHPLLAAAEAAKSAASAILGAFTSIGHAADKMGEDAEKAGVSVEFLTGIGAAFKDAGSSVEGLADSIKFLNRNAAEAAEGNAETIAAFGKLGISAREVSEGLGDTEGLFFAVADAIASLDTPAQKTRAAMELLGRGGSDAIAALNKGSGGLKAMAADVAALGGVIDKDLADAGDKFGTLETLIDATWTGVQKTLARPILNFVAEHFEEIKGRLFQVAGQIGEALGGVGDKVAGMIPSLIDFGGSLISGAVEAFKTWGPTIGSVLDLLGSMASLVNGVLGPVLQALRPVIQLIADAMRALADVVKTVVDGLREMLGLASSAASIGGSGSPAGGPGYSHDIRGGQGSGSPTIGPVTVNVGGIDANEASSALAKKIQPGIRDALAKQRYQLSADKADWVERGL